MSLSASAQPVLSTQSLCSGSSDQTAPLPVLLDCTLRDGGYPIHFQFTEKDVRVLCQGLSKAGINHIEVGHGLGLGASGVEHGVAFESDDCYIQAARQAAPNARIGVFFIPQIGTEADIRRAVEAGADFIRIGTNITEHQSAFSFAEQALTMGLDVHLNLMKSYAVAEDDFSQTVRQWRDYGLSSLYVVDSAGCMVPDEVHNLITRVQQEQITPGFHGHNNLDLANANSLAAIKAGAVYVDATLRGMGRSSGNAQTEVMAHLLNKSAGSQPYQVFELFDIIERCLEPLMVKSQGQPVMNTITGISRFHSGFLPRFKRVLSHYDVDLKRLIMAVSSIDCVDPAESLIETVARDLARTDG